MTISPDDDGRASRSQVRLSRASIVTPGDWIEFDLDPATRRTSIRRAVRQAIAHAPSLATDVVRLIGLLDRTTRRAIDAGAFYCASRVIEDTNRDIAVATVLIQLSPSQGAALPDQPTWVPRASAGERCTSIARGIRNDPAWAGADVRVVPMSFVGPSVRLNVQDGGAIVQYLVPVMDATAGIVLTFTCPCPPYAQVMTELFDTMAQSLVLHYD